MNDDSARDIVLSILRYYDLNAQPIYEINDKKTPDLFVEGGGRRILIEVKSKEDDQQLRQLLEGPTGTQMLYNSSSLDTILRDAWRQIREFPQRHLDDLTLIWFIARAIGGITILSRSAIRSLLYGTAILEGRRRDGTSYEKECYFFTESAFFKRKKLDGVILHEKQDIELCLNPYSSGSSTLAGLLGSIFATIDPKKLEANGKCFIADCNHDRRNRKAVLQFLKEKYLLDTVSILDFRLFNLPANSKEE